MYNFSINNKSVNNIFQNVYNFQTPANLYVYKSALGELSSSKNEKRLSYKDIGLLAGAGCLLFFSRGVQRKSKKVLENLREFFDAKQGMYFFDERNPKVSIYDYAIRKINSFIQKTESINNFNSIKDMLFMKIMFKTTPTKFIHKGISSFFEFLSRNTVEKSYKKTQKYFNKMYANFDKLDEYILKTGADELVEFKDERLSKKILIERARDNRAYIRMVVDSYISKFAQDMRYDYMKKSTASLYSEIWNSSFKDFWTKNNKFKRREMWQTFIAAEKIKDNKTELTNNVAIARNILSYTDLEKKEYISTCVSNLSSIIPNDDAVGIEIINRLKWYVKDGSLLNDNIGHFQKELERLENHKIKTNLREDVEQNQIKDVDANIKQIRTLIREDAPGDIDKMLAIYRKIVPVELSRSGTLKSLQKAISSFDTSIKLEKGEFFDKLRDLEIGSAPTDILTILLSSAGIIYALNKARNKEEQTSILLKSGIPIAGAVAVALVSASRLVSGSKSLALGFVSGIVLNRIGKVVDDYRKNRIKNRLS